MTTSPLPWGKIGNKPANRDAVPVGYPDDDNFDPEVTRRRQEQIAENIAIGEGSEEYPASTVMTVSEMLSTYTSSRESVWRTSNTRGGSSP
jgi:hypothetical protein